MSQKTYLTQQKFSKTFLYPNPTNLYQYYCNAFAYSELINTYQETKPAKQKIMEDANLNLADSTPQQHKIDSQQSPSTPSSSTSNFSLVGMSPDQLKLFTPGGTSKNAAAQRQAILDIELAQKKVSEFRQLITMTTDEELAKDLYTKIQHAENNIIENQRRLKRLKSGAEAQERFRQKRQKRLSDSPGSVRSGAESIELNNGDGSSMFQESTASIDLGYASTIESVIDEISEELRTISLGIHEKPELAYQEKFAHDTLTDYLESKGFRVVRQAYGLETAFHAEYTSPIGPGRIVAINSEYDALPGIGHGCGHIAAAIGVMTVMKMFHVPGKIILLGTPAEAGKIKLIQAGAYKGIDASLMVHPAHADAIYGNYLASASVNVEYFGKGAHAAGSPWEGANALDAVVSAYNSISLLRQQLHPTNRVHGIITNGGKALNVITDYASAKFNIRAPSKSQLTQLRYKITACFDSAATATACNVKLTWDPEYNDVLVNEHLAERFARYMSERGVHYRSKQDELKVTKSSTDMVWKCQLRSAKYNIGTQAKLHTEEFANAAKSLDAHISTIRAAKCLSLTAIDVFVDDNLYKAAFREFKSTLQNCNDDQ
ncbi:4518_t:CDS:10 [Entrophospora sp. SA101]|nr:4518_t:CDS:10 [Entrophospora sp. SA101]